MKVSKFSYEKLMTIAAALQQNNITLLIRCYFCQVGILHNGINIELYENYVI